jgi:hypothetical protein
MPEPIALDEIPDADSLFGNDTSDSVTTGKVQCPECERLFLPTGLKRHITMAHRDGVSDSSSSPKKASKVVVDISDRWAQFQRGAALMVAFACSDCAAILVEDANEDGRAIAEFCSHRPKLRKNLETFLNASDAMILIGALGGTAKKMMEHHSIGQKIGLSAINPEHMGHGNGMEGIAQFMQQLSEEDRNALLNDAFASMAATNGARPEPEPVKVPEADWSPSGVVI